MEAKAKIPQEDGNLSQRIRDAVGQCSASDLEGLLDPLTSSEALRELLLLSPAERDIVLEIVPAGLAAGLVEEAPNEMAVELVERLDPERAAEILEQLDSDIQADVIGELNETDAEAILSEMDEEDAADVRLLSTYDDDTAGGLMMTEVFRFNDTQTVGNVLRNLASDDDDFERYRGQHP